MTWRAVVFDLDGTLVDSAGTVVEATREACLELGLSPPDEEAVRTRIGLPLATMLAGAGAPAGRMDEAMAAYRRAYPACAERCERPFTRIPELLDDLAEAGVLLAVATGKSQGGADNAVHRHAWVDRFQVVLGAAAHRRGKPAPDLLLEVLEGLGVAPAEAVMVGDTTFDLAMARAAGVGAIGVTWGVHDEVRLRAERPLEVVRDPGSLRRVLGFGG